MGEHLDTVGTSVSAEAASDIEALIVGYFDACTAGDAEAVAGHFTENAVIYDTNHAPVQGATTIGRFWSRIASKWRSASWHCERLVTDGDTAAIEWRMAGTMAGPAGRRDNDMAFAVRGSEHYDFDPGTDSGERLIAEIRQYWTFDLEHPSSELVDYPYGEPGRLGS